MLISIIVALVVVGVLLWAVNSIIPMDAKIKQILNVVVVVAVIFWLLRAFGLLGRFPR
jgi:uncharacterized membrane protein YwzB